MPIFSITTNVSISSEKKIEVATELSKVIARILGKPESYVCVHINSDQSLTFGGSSDPAGFAELKSIGGVGGKRNNEHAAELYPIIEKHLGIVGNRFYIQFTNIGPADVAFSGNTFA